MWSPTQPRGKKKYWHRKKKRENVQKTEPPEQQLGKAPTQRVSNAVQSAVPLPTVEQMTSRDFHIDINARIEVAMDMLKDVRNNYFRDAILQNKHLFRGRTVLNLGCSLGLHAMFAAKAGAKKVYAIDNSNVVDYTRKIVAANGYADVIDVKKARVELLQLPVAKVDVIICDWEGNSLFYESKLDEVIYARDKWLKRGGIIFPDAAKLYVAGLEDPERRNERIEFWINVHGFNMKAIRHYAVSEPFFQSVPMEKLISRPTLIKSVDVYTVTAADLNISTQFHLMMKHAGSIDAVVTYSTISFKRCHVPITFTSAPNATDTRWINTLYFLDERVAVVEGEQLFGAINLASKGKNDLFNMRMMLEFVRQNTYSLEAQMWWNLKPCFIADRTLPADAESQQQVAELNNNGGFNMTKLKANLPK